MRAILEQLQDMVRERHRVARQWKERTGRGTIGYFCTYVPEEIIYAAGLLPVRIIGSHEPQDVTEPYMFNMYCAFSRDCLAQGLKGRYDYLDGVVAAHSCLHLRQAFASWVRHIPLPFHHYLFMPSLSNSPAAQECLTGELARLKEALERWMGREITRQDLLEAIEIYNTNRRLLRKIYELRKAASPVISGAEAMEIVLSSMVMDKADHNRLLEQLLEQLPLPEEAQEPPIRLMIVGSENDDLELIRLIESLGTRVVIDDHCTGSRYFWEEIEPQEDLLNSIALRYLRKPPCPLKDLVNRNRFSFIQGLIEEFQVQGVFFLQQKFCDPHQFDYPPLMAKLKEENIPSLLLELDTTVPAGQFRTRIEAFLELLRLEVT